MRNCTASPHILFVLASLAEVRATGGGSAFTLVGHLTFPGVTRPVRIPSVGSAGSQAVEVRGTFPIRMTDYRIPIPRFLFVSVKDEGLVSFRLHWIPWSG